MRQNTKRRAGALIRFALVLAIADATAQMRPGISGPALPGNLAGSSGPAPTLIAPAPGEQIATGPTSSTAVIFRWSMPSGAPGPQRYRLCVAQAGVAASAACNMPGAALYPIGQVMTYQAQIPPRFHDKALQWTVAACGPGYGGGLAVVGATNTDCSAWAPPRSLDAGYQPPLLSLQSPVPGTTASTASQRFTWSGPQPGSPGIDGYRFCLAENVSLCEQASLGASQGVIVPTSPADRTFVDISIPPLRASARREMKWTVLSCKSGTCRRAANQPERTFVISAPLPAPALIAPSAGSIEPAQGDTRTHGYTRPEDGREVRSLVFPASIGFKWSQVRDATQHRLCLSPPGVACGTGASHVVTARFRDSESLEWASLGRFHGQNVNWSVAACDALGCGPWAAPQALTIKAVPGQVALNAPAAGANLTSHPMNVPVAFTWSPVPFAESYRLYVGDVQLTSQTTQCSTYRAGLPYSSTPVNWLVQACNVVGCGAPSSVRAITTNPQVSGASSRRGSGTTSGNTRAVGPSAPRCL